MLDYLLRKFKAESVKSNKLTKLKSKKSKPTALPASFLSFRDLEF